MSTTPTTSFSDKTGDSTRPSPVLIGSFIAILAIFAWLFWAFIQRQIEWAIQEQADWGHTLVIPFISGWFVYLNRSKIFAEPFKPAWTGLLLILVGTAIYSVSALGPMMLKHHNIMGFGAGLTLIGLVLYFCGWRAMRWLWFPTLYLIVFGQTISDRFLEIVTYQLQDIAAAGAYYGLALIGYDVERSGNTLQIFHMGELVPVNIAEACSGMRMLVAFLALGVAMAYSGMSHLWQRVLLVILAVPTAVFVNILRVMTLGILSTRDSGFAAGDFHTMVGLLWLIPAFFVYLGIMWILKNLVLEEGDESEPQAEESVKIQFDHRTRLAFTVSVVVLIAAGISFQYAAVELDVHLRKEPVPPRHAVDSIPYMVGPWSSARSQELRMDEAGVEQLGTDLYLTRRYVNEQDPDVPAMQLHLAYYTGHLDTIPHVPDRCLVAGGLTQEQAEPLNLDLGIEMDQWEIDPDHTLDGQSYRLAKVDRGSGESERVRLPVGSMQLRTTEFGDPEQPQLQVFAGYFFIANGRVTPQPSGVKMLAFKAQDKKAYFCKVQITAVSATEMSLDEFVELASGFLELMIPEIMRVLPDWVEVTSQLESESA